jgi:methionyl-tRNA formyltransferase
VTSSPSSADRGQPLRVVVLTVGGRFGVLALRALRGRGITPAAVVVEAHPALRDCFHKRTRIGRVAEIPLALLRSLWRRLRPRLRRDLRVGAPVIVSGPLNSARMQADLKRLRPDLLVLGGIGILSRDLLAIPRLGTINVHLALLPWVRGNDVIAHSVLRDVPIGSTCHLVDSGIDTGPILTRRLVDPARADPSLAAIEEASVVAAAEHLTDVVQHTVAAGRLPAAVSQGERFPLCRFLDAGTRATADARIRAGHARMLFDLWSANAIGDDLSLPSELRAPAIRVAKA